MTIHDSWLFPVSEICTVAHSNKSTGKIACHSSGGSQFTFKESLPAHQICRPQVNQTQQIDELSTLFHILYMHNLLHSLHTLHFVLFLLLVGADFF